MAQKLSVDSVKIEIPDGIPDNTSTKGYTGKLKHCPDNATSMDDSRCINITMTDVDCTFTETSTICDIPTSIGFSVFAVFMAEVITEVSSTTSPSTSSTTITKTIVPSKTQLWSTMEAGTINTMALNTEGIAFTEIAMDIKNTLSNVELKVEATESKPAVLEKAATGTVYRYIHIQETNSHQM